MSIYQKLANATFQVVAGDSRGSGFSFLRNDLVITNLHVVRSIIDSKKRTTITPIILVTELGQALRAELVYVDGKNDFAILRLSESLPAGREILQPHIGFIPERGLRTIFAGFPHGISQLLTSEAIISSPLENGQFALDGMVNGGNSGGPVVDARDCKVVGIVTQRRYIGEGTAKEITEKLKQLWTIFDSQDLSHLGITMNIGGVDPAKTNKTYSEALMVIIKMLEKNANSGIGIGFPIQPVIDVIQTKYSHVS